MDGTISNTQCVAVWVWCITSSSQRRRAKRVPRKEKIKTHFLHACWEPVFLHVLGQVLEATLEFRLSFSHLKDAGRHMLTRESCLIGHYNHLYVTDILSDADAVECGPFSSGSKFESQV